MSSSGLVDVVLTSDSDIFMFGTHYILRLYVTRVIWSLQPSTNYIYRTSVANNPTSTKEDFYIYSIDVLENVDEVQLTRGGLILLVLLSGGDYHDGMQGCGLTITHGLARCGFGDCLVEAFDGMPRDAFFGYLCHTWADELSAELHSISKGFL